MHYIIYLDIESWIYLHMYYVRFGIRICHENLCSVSMSFTTSIDQAITALGTETGEAFGYVETKGRGFHLPGHQYMGGELTCRAINFWQGPQLKEIDVMKTTSGVSVS